MSKRDPRLTLRQIAEYARYAQQFCAGTTLNELIADTPKVLGFERAIEIVGEAVKRLPPELTARYPSVPWKEIAGTRNHLSHGYDTLDYTVLWDAVTLDVPVLLRTVEQMLADLDNGPQS